MPMIANASGERCSPRVRSCKPCAICGRWVLKYRLVTAIPKSLYSWNTPYRCARRKAK